MKRYLHLEVLPPGVVNEEGKAVFPQRILALEADLYKQTEMKSQIKTDWGAGVLFVHHKNTISSTAQRRLSMNTELRDKVLFFLS